MNKCNDKGEPHGYWENYHPNGSRSISSSITYKIENYIEKNFTYEKRCYTI